MISKELIRESSGFHSANTLRNDLRISEGDLRYLRDNGLVNNCIVDDDASWRLDDDGNWPEVL